MLKAPHAICGCTFVFTSSTPSNIAVKLHEEGGKHQSWLRNGPSKNSKGMFRGFFVKKGKDADKKDSIIVEETREEDSVEGSMVGWGYPDD